MGLFSKKKEKKEKKREPIGKTAKKVLNDSHGEEIYNLEEDKYKPKPITKPIETNPKKLVKELVGTGFFYSKNLGSKKIPDSQKEIIHKKVKEAWKNGASTNVIQSTYDRLINESYTREKVNKKNEIERINEKIRYGVYCELAKSVEGPVSDGLSNVALNSLVFGTKYGFALGALSSGTDIERKTIGIPATIKVVPNGVVITPENDSEMRMPFNEIINFNNDGIKIVGGRIIPILKCDYINEIRSLVNKSASGVEEEGWG